jgi:L-ascorbate metabolism protein UlaG (beta-lactamase superfamily)
MQLTFLGHSAVRLNLGEHDLIIDPFLSGNPLCPLGPDDVEPSYILLTHAHDDHIGDTEAIARRTGATIVSGFEIASYYGTRDLRTHGMNPGGGFDFPFGRVTFTPAWHSSSFPDGSYGGMPMGLMVSAGGKRLYHAGDTALFSDMALIGRHGLDVALIPIGDNFTMGPDDALEAVKLLKPKRVIPIHYDTFDLIRQDAAAFRQRVETETDALCSLLSPGEGLSV